MSDYAEGVAALRKTAARNFATAERDVAGLRALFAECEERADRALALLRNED